MLMLILNTCNTPQIYIVFLYSETNNSFFLFLTEEIRSSYREFYPLVYTKTIQKIPIFAHKYFLNKPPI